MDIYINIVELQCMCNLALLGFYRCVSNRCDYIRFGTDL